MFIVNSRITEIALLTYIKVKQKKIIWEVFSFHARRYMVVYIKHFNIHLTSDKMIKPCPSHFKAITNSQVTSFPILGFYRP